MASTIFVLVEKRRMKFICIALLWIISGGWSQQPWQEFESQKGGFRILVPGQMEHKQQLVEAAIGELTYIQFWHQPTSEDPDNFLYSVSYVDYPEHSIHSDSTDFIDDFFHFTIDTSVKKVGGELRYVDDIQIGEYPGRLWRVDYNKGHGTIKTKVYLVGRRLYQLQVVMHRDKSLNTLQDRFFDSFTLLE